MRRGREREKERESARDAGHSPCQSQHCGSGDRHCVSLALMHLDKGRNDVCAGFPSLQAPAHNPCLQTRSSFPSASLLHPPPSRHRWRPTLALSEGLTAKTFSENLKNCSCRWPRARGQTGKYRLNKTPSENIEHKQSKILGNMSLCLRAFNLNATSHITKAECAASSQ